MVNACWTWREERICVGERGCQIVPATRLGLSHTSLYCRRSPEDWVAEVWRYAKPNLYTEINIR
jgi:hypothetical protein